MRGQSMQTVREALKTLSTGNVKTHAYEGLTPSDKSALKSASISTYTGKVRDVVSVGDEIYVVHSDRLTAFDTLIGLVPYKGTILTAISEFWLSEAKKVVPTHLISSPSERILKCEKTTPFKVEVVIRGFLAGSLMRAYEEGDREFCGATLPEGLKAYGALPEPIITPTTKAAAFEHDENISPDEIISHGLVSRDDWNEICQMTQKLFRHGQEVFAQHGWILVDTKYEFGKTKDGRIIVIDEIHTPDSSRLWVKKTYQTRIAQGLTPEMLDKENVRRYLISKGFKGHGSVPEVPLEKLIELAEVYLKVAEELTGKPVTTIGANQSLGQFVREITSSPRVAAKP